MNLVTWLSTRQKTSVQITILLLLATVVLILPAGSWDLRGPDEGRYTQIAKELLTSNNWLALKVMGKPYDQKPPLAFWLFAGALKANGGEPSSWFLRMPSVLAAIGMLLTTFFLGRKYADAKAGLLAGLMMLSSIAFLDDAPTVELNMLFSFFTTASLAVWLLNFERDRLTWPQWAAMWLLLAAAFMVKGPLAILVVLSAIGYTAWVARSLQPFRAVRVIWGMALVLAIIGIWFLAQSHAFGSDFVEEQVSGETVGRFLKGDHGEPFWYYFPRIFTAYMGPWAILLVAALVHLWRSRRRNAPLTAPLLGWIIFPFIVLLLANGKRVPYMLPMLPAACVLAAGYASIHLAPYVMRPRYHRTLTSLLFIATVIVFGISIGLFFPLGILEKFDMTSEIQFRRIDPIVAIGFALILGYLAVSFTRSRRTWQDAIWATAIAILLFQMFDFIIIRPAMDPGKSTRAFSTKVASLLHQEHETTLLTLPELAEPEYHVYSHYKVLGVRKSKLDLTSTTLPRVLALKDDERKTSGPVAQAAGYQEKFDLSVTKRPVTVYLRKKQP